MCHFADDVEYEVTGFVEKNRDNVNQEHLAILRASEVCLFVYLLFCTSVSVYMCLYQELVRQQNQNRVTSIKLNKEHLPEVGGIFVKNLVLCGSISKLVCFMIFHVSESVCSMVSWIFNSSFV